MSPEASRSREELMRLPLELQRVGTERRVDRRLLFQIRAVRGLFRGVHELGQELDEMDFAIGVRVREWPHSVRRFPGAVDPRKVVGVMWGAAMHIRGRAAKYVDPETLELMMVATDSSYRGAAEWWMMDRLKEAMPLRGWRHVVVTSPVDMPDHQTAKFARRQGFAPKDLKKGEVFWQWPESIDGIEPADPPADLPFSR